MSVGNRVGIGITDPQYTLDVAGDLNITGGLFTNGQDVSGALYWTETAGENIVANTNVGIGITGEPVAFLHVGGDARIDGNLTVNGTQTVINTNVEETSRIEVTNNGTGPAMVVNQTGAQPVADFQDDGVSAFFIADGGNVGIGTTNPVESLHIHNGRLRIDSLNNDSGTLNVIDNNSFGLYIHGNGGSSAIQGKSLINFHHFSISAINSNTPGIPLEDATPTGQIGFIENSLSAGWLGSFIVRTKETSAKDAPLFERMRVTSAGNVGIGTTNPIEKLHVEGNIRHTGMILANNGFTEVVYNGNENVNAKFVTGQRRFFTFSSGVPTIQRFFPVNFFIHDINASPSDHGMYSMTGKYAVSIIRDTAQEITEMHAGTLEIVFERRRPSPRGLLVKFVDTPLSERPGGLIFEHNWKLNWDLPDSDSASGRLQLELELTSSVTANAGAAYYNFEGQLQFSGVSRANQVIDNTTFQDSNAHIGTNISTATKGFIIEGGNVGIGTASPSEKIVVDDGANAQAITMQKDGFFTDQNQALLFRAKASGGGQGIITGAIHKRAEDLRVISQGDVSRILFYTGSDPNSGYDSFVAGNPFAGTYTNTDDIPKMTIANNGNVGIGVTNPESALSVVGPLNALTQQVGVHMGVFTGSGGGFAGMEIVSSQENGGWIDFKRDTGNSDYHGRIRYASSGEFAGMGFYTGDGVSVPGIERMRITTAGNVGIGLTNPGSRLRIDGNPSTLAEKTVVRIQGASTGGDSVQQGLSLLTLVDQSTAQGNMKGIAFARSANANFVAGIQHSILAGGGGNLDFYTSPAGQDDALSMIMRLGGNGNVGIGTSNPTEKLHVDGNVRIGSAVMSQPSGSAPLYSARAWAIFDGTATSPITPLNTGNVSSITRTSTGLFTVNFTVAMPTANWGYSITGGNPSSDGETITGALRTDIPRSTTSIAVAYGASAKADPPVASVIVFC